MLDAGVTPAGRPYFVMELVKGVPITKFCDEHQLTLRGRLELFVPVCQAIQHAHQKGIIHRDIKPSNILVTLHDGVAVPKVIDFGIAKALEQKLTDKTLFTQFEQFIGTPAYTSPEQAEMSGLDIDTRSDIYSLGVVLYELLTSQLPFPAKDGTVDRSRDPRRPSTLDYIQAISDDWFELHGDRRGAGVRRARGAPAGGAGGPAHAAAGPHDGPAERNRAAAPRAPAHCVAWLRLWLCQVGWGHGPAFGTGASCRRT